MNDSFNQLVNPYIMFEFDVMEEGTKFKALSLNY